MGNQLIEDTVSASSSPTSLEARNTSDSPSSTTEEEAPSGGQEAKVRDETWGSGESFPAKDLQEEAQPADAKAEMTLRIDMGKEPVQEPQSASLDVVLEPKKEEAAPDDQHVPENPEASAGVMKTSDVLEEVTPNSPEKEAQIISTGYSPAEGIDLPPPLRIFPPDCFTPRAHQIRDIFRPESPQIGTTLLRRESLRKKDSPRKGPGRPKGSSPKKQLKKRDTLQEREILQRFEESDAENKKDLEQPDTPAIHFTSSVNLLPNVQPGFSNNASIESVGNDVDDEQIINDVDEAILENQDVQRAVEAIEASEEIHPSTNVTGHNDTGYDDNANQQAYQAIAQTEIDEAQAAITAVCEKADLPVRKTRSGTRFSDDTSMLKDFLNRAQARKAAQGGGFSPKIPKSLQQSPKRSPQKKNAIRPASRSSPKKAGVLIPKQARYRKGSPSGKISLFLAKSDNEEDDDGHDAETNGEETKAADPGSCRRSTRTRLPTPAKNPPGAPSFIPVRRTDGTDPVVLQKTQAQELAITTRANTRRNKGQSKPPALALQDISSDDTESTTSSRQRAANGKAVVWAEQLTSFQEWQEGITEESEEQLPKVKRMRGLGNPTGTPVAKRTGGITGASNGTPAPKRRGTTR
ncbi:MAG: hypothetical protein OHK93_003211 [Ramalina farinacea]|uniref:Uncharacterized protein n=1 Tax=Ramalina farinacea TaxID=258253 RepID=A0AA43TZL3_9LECA|nr:hypothetical protein [Ramalina farinacea]